MISIIIPTYNSEKTLSRTLNSLIIQHYSNFQVVFIDAGSTDNTRNIIIDFIETNSFNCRKVFEPDNGVWNAINKGIKASTGDLIMVLNSDDYLYEGALSHIGKVFENQNVNFYFGSVMKGKRLKTGWYPKKMKYSFDKSYSAHSVGFIARSLIFEKLGFYSENYKISSDYDFFFRLSKSKEFLPTGYSDNFLIGYFDVHGLSKQVSYITHLNEQIQIRLKNGQSHWYVYLHTCALLLKNWDKVSCGK